MTVGESIRIRRCGLDGHDCEVLIDDTRLNNFDIGKLTNISGTLCVQNHL